MIIPGDQIRFLLGILLSIPLSLLLRFIKGARIKTYYSLGLSLTLQFYVYEWELWIPVLIYPLSYILILLKGRKCGAFITIISLAITSAYHIYRLIVAYGSWSLDVSTILMMLVCKNSMFAYAYQDGGVEQSKLKFDYQKANKIQKLPQFIDYLGYNLFLPTCIINTAIDYKDYDDYMKLNGRFQNIPLWASFKKAFLDLGIGLACFLLYLFGTIYFPLYPIKEQQFADNSSLYIFYYSFFFVYFIKFKYYFGWKFSQFPVHVSGISYLPLKNTKDQKSELDDFNGVRNCDPWVAETSIHLRDKIANWNISCQEWLRRCVYDRLPVPKAQGQLITFIISAFWHGYYGGYYFSFFFWFVQLHVAGLVFKFSQQKQNPLMKFYRKYERIFYPIIWLIWAWYFSQNGVFFHVLSVKQCLLILSNTGYFLLWSLLLLVFIFTFIPKGKKGNQKLKGVVKVQGSSQVKQQ